MFNIKKLCVFVLYIILFSASFVFSQTECTFPPDASFTNDGIPETNPTAGEQVKSYLINGEIFGVVTVIGNKTCSGAGPEITSAGMLDIYKCPVAGACNTGQPPDFQVAGKIVDLEHASFTFMLPYSAFGYEYKHSGSGLSYKFTINPVPSFVFEKEKITWTNVPGDTYTISNFPQVIEAQLDPSFGSANQVFLTLNSGADMIKISSETPGPNLRFTIDDVPDGEYFAYITAGSETKGTNSAPKKIIISAGLPPQSQSNTFMYRTIQRTGDGSTIQVVDAFLEEKAFVESPGETVELFKIYTDPLEERWQYKITLNTTTTKTLTFKAYNAQNQVIFTEQKTPSFTANEPQEIFFTIDKTVLSDAIDHVELQSSFLDYKFSDLKKDFKAALPDAISIDIGSAASLGFGPVGIGGNAGYELVINFKTGEVGQFIYYTNWPLAGGVQPVFDDWPTLRWSNVTWNLTEHADIAFIWNLEKNEQYLGPFYSFTGEAAAGIEGGNFSVFTGSKDWLNDPFGGPWGFKLGPSVGLGAGAMASKTWYKFACDVKQPQPWCNVRLSKLELFLLTSALFGPGVALALVSQYQPGGDHPDDAQSVARITSDEKAIWKVYRGIALNKGSPLVKRYVEYKDAVLALLEYLDSLPDGVQPDTNILTPLENTAWTLYHELDAQRVQLGKEWKEVLKTDIGIFVNGFYASSFTMLGIVEQIAGLVDVSFNPSDIVKKHPILIVPSGGLYGLSSSEILKAKLADYVNRGGVLLVFSQQHGYEFSALPGGEVSGYGWREDQSCFSNAAYIDTWHAILRHQWQSSLTGSIDGYFTKWPANATLLYRRTKNHMPAALVYKYGSGYVFATTLYSDYAFSTGQFTEQEQTLIQDLLAWAKLQDKDVTVFPANTQVTFPLQLTNASAQDATSVTLTVKSVSDSVSVSEETKEVVIPAGQTVSYDYIFTTPARSDRVYDVSYTLSPAPSPLNLVYADNFLVRSPLANVQPYEGLVYYLSTPSEETFVGLPYTITHHLKNTTQVTLGGTLYYHNSPAGRLPFTSFSVDPGEEVSVPHTLLGTYSTTGRVVCYNGFAVLGNGKEAGSYQLCAHWSYLKISASLQTGLSYRAGQEVEVFATLKNPQTSALPFSRRLFVTDPDNVIIHDETAQETLAAGEQKIISYRFTLLQTQNAGVYSVQLSLEGDSGKLSYTNAAFSVLAPQVVITPTVPVLQGGETNTLSFFVENTGELAVTQGSLITKLFDPGNQLVFSSTQPFTLSQGQNDTLSVPVNLPATTFGDYRLEYELLSQAGTLLKGRRALSNTLTASVQYDKPFYRARESVTGTVIFKNTGSFVQNANGTFKIGAQTSGFSLSLTPNETSTQSFSLSLPAILPSGMQALLVNVLPNFTQSFSFPVPTAKLEFALSKQSFIPTESVPLLVKNTGGVDMTASLLASLVDSNENVQKRDSQSVSLQAGEEKTMAFSLFNANLVEGQYRVSVAATYAANEKTSFDRYIFLQGIKAATSVTTNKKVYKKGDPVNVSMNVIPTGTLQNATLKLTIKQKKESFATYPQLPLVYAILVDTPLVWFGTANGLVKHDTVKNTWTTYSTGHGLADPVILSLSRDAQYIWAGTANGLTRILRTNFSMKSYTDAQGFPSVTITSLASDGNTLWLGTWDGLVKFDKIKETFSVLTTNDGLPENRISSLLVDGNTLWVGTPASGLAKLDKITSTFTNVSLPNPRVNALSVDETSLWIATQGGVVKLEKATNAQTLFMQQPEGLAANLVYAVGVDGHFVCFGTYAGLSRYDTITNTWQTFTTEQGLPENIVRVVAVEEEKIWLGTAKP